MTNLKLEQDTLPELYQSADQASLSAECLFFWGLHAYLILLVTAALVSFIWPKDSCGSIASSALFLISLGIIIALRVKRPDDLWYNGRAVSESVKTRSWRWCMRSKPYEDTDNDEVVSKQFINDLNAILNQNRSLSVFLQSNAGIRCSISATMRTIRGLSLEERLELYKEQRIRNQANWYSLKSQFNKHRAKQWFWVSVILHGTAICMLLYSVRDAGFSPPVGVVATAAGAVLTWLQAKKHNELNSIYALTAHEIVLIKGEALSVKSEKQLSEFVINSETAFSREHTQWAARKTE